MTSIPESYLKANWHFARLALRSALALIISAAVAYTGMFLDTRDIAIVDTIDNYIGDWRIALGSRVAEQQNTEIAVVLISEKTLLDYESRSPIDRNLIAKVVRAVDAAGPRAIVLDFIFDRRTDQDAALLDVLQKDHIKSPVVLGAIDERLGTPKQSLEIQREFLEKANQPFGHLLIERKQGFLATTSDSTVRLVAAPYKSDSLKSVSFAPTTAETKNGSQSNAPGATVPLVEQILKVLGKDPGNWNRIISWVRPSSTEYPLFVTIEVPQHKPDAVDEGLQGLMLDGTRDLLKNRIVLIGGAMDDRDKHATPLTVMSGEKMHGIMIHAQALSQRLEGNRDVVIWSWWQKFALVWIIALCCYLLARAGRVDPQGFFYSSGGLILIGVASLFAFIYFRLDLPSTALMTAWLGGGLTGVVSSWILKSRRS